MPGVIVVLEKLQKSSMGEFSFSANVFEVWGSIMHTAFSLYLKKKCKNFNQSFVKNKLDEKYKSFFYLKKMRLLCKIKKDFSRAWNTQFESTEKIQLIDQTILCLKRTKNNIFKVVRNY